MFKFNVTYELVTPESAEQGDVAERGFISQGVSLRDAVNDLTSTRTTRVDYFDSVECDEKPIANPRWITVNNGIEHDTGAYESRSLHLPDDITPSSKLRIYALVTNYL